MSSNFYLPPDANINKDYLKQVFENQKGFLTRDELRSVDVPLYDELSVSTLWPLMHQNERFMYYFPNQMPKGKLPPRTYFFNVLNTVEHEYT